MFSLNLFHKSLDCTREGKIFSSNDFSLTILQNVTFIYECSCYVFLYYFSIASLFLNIQKQCDIGLQYLEGSLQ